MNVAVINYGMGNLRSVINAFEAIGCSTAVACEPKDLHGAERIVLPGVGAFGDGMRNLREKGWIEVLEEEVRVRGKPFLGICLGMQLLAMTGTEHGICQGLGWIAGVVERLDPADPSLRVPHIGWNDVRFSRDGGLFAGLPESAVFYFVHSYVLKPDDPSMVSSTCNYGGDFAASIESGNLFATQFHPEKSQQAGLRVLTNFLAV